MANYDLEFRTTSMYNYHADRTALIDLFRRCQSTNRESALMGAGSQSLTLFHCEFTDYLWCMGQYPESYCHYLVQSPDGQIVAAFVSNLKRVQFGPYVMTAVFNRLTRVDPTRRRDNIAVKLLFVAGEWLQRIGVDYSQGYTLGTNVPSLGLQQKLLELFPTQALPLDIFVLPTESNPTAARVHKLTQTETERLWMVDLVDWIGRPVLSDLRRIMKMNEYVGTFAVGNFLTGEYAVASVWQPSNAILCDDRSNKEHAYRGAYRLAFNFFQSPSATSCSSDEKRLLLSALGNATATDGIPFILCHIEQSSPFNVVCRSRAVAMTTDILSRHKVSDRMTVAGDEFDKLPVWLDPRDFSGLLYFGPLSNKVQSGL